MRELRLAQCNLISDDALNVSEACWRGEMPRTQFSSINPPLYKLDSHMMLESLRILDLTACNLLHDSSVEQIIDCAPRLRILILAKCVEITDKSVMAICKLGKNLHDIHLGRCQQITDNALKELVKACNRIRYIDLAGCALVTDAAVKQLATLPKLRRIGLVKCTEITDRSILALAKAYSESRDPRQRNHQPASNLERVHLSYCTNITLSVRLTLPVPLPNPPNPKSTLSHSPHPANLLPSGNPRPPHLLPQTNPPLPNRHPSLLQHPRNHAILPRCARRVHRRAAHRLLRLLRRWRQPPTRLPCASPLGRPRRPRAAPQSARRRPTLQRRPRRRPRTPDGAAGWSA